MQENVFSNRLSKLAIKYGHAALVKKTEQGTTKSLTSLADRSLLAPDRGSTPEESLRILGYVMQTYPGDLMGQANNFFKLVDIPAASGSGHRKGRKVSHATVERYYQTVILMIQELRDQNIKPGNLSDLSYKHISIIFKHWESKGLSSSTISNRYSVLKRFYKMIGKDKPPELRSILSDPSIATRSQTATKSLDWNANGINADEVLKMIEAEDQRVATTLKLCLHFGMRLKEAVSFMPLSNIHDNVILINKGAKGGRARVVPIETDEQRNVLKEACMRANPRTGYLGQSKRLDTNLHHVYSVLKVFGITKNASGVTVHGLRHTYLNKVYEAITGVKSPINGGGNVEKETDLKARLEVSRRAGHARPQIASAYVGTHKHLSKIQRNKVHLTINLIQNSQPVREAFQRHEREMSELGYSIEVSITGPHALGYTTPTGTTIHFGLTISKGAPITEGNSIDLSYQAYRIGAELETHLSEALRHPCTVKEMNRFPSDTPVLALQFS